MSSYKISNTSDLLTLNERAIKKDLNRSVQHDWLTEIADPEGTHVYEMMLYGHNMDHAPLHHRCRVLVRTKGQEEGTEIILDIMDEDWRKLSAVPEEALA